MEWGLQRLQSLKILGFMNDDLDCWDVGSFPEEYLLPTTVTYLWISGFGNLRKLDNKGFQHLTSLQNLRIGGCPKLKHMPQEGLPVSISHIQIRDCPLLTKRLQRKKGKEWRNIVHTPFIEIIEHNLISPVRADEDNEDNLIDPEAVDELREIETRMVRQVYGERSLSLVAGSFFPPAKSEAGSGSWDWNETNPDSPLNISSIFPSTVSETDDSSPEFSRSNSNSIMSIFLPATSPKHSPENYEIIVRSRSIPSYSIMSIFPPTMSEIGSPDNYEIIFRNPSIRSGYHFFPPDMSDTDSYGSSTPNHQLSIPSYYHCFPPDMSDTDSYGSSTPNHQLSIPPS